MHNKPDRLVDRSVTIDVVAGKCICLKPLNHETSLKGEVKDVTLACSTSNEKKQKQQCLKRVDGECTIVGGRVLSMFSPKSNL